MPVQVVSREHYPFICEMFDEAVTSVKIISPFIGSDMAQLLTDNMAVNPALKVEIITRFYREDFIKGVSKITALEMLHRAGAKIYALIGLHTKLYLFDTDIALLGSANFTSGGFKLNHELSLCVENESEVNPQLVSYFDELVNAINLSGDYLLTADKIAEEKRLVESITKARKDKNTEYRNEAKFGANITVPKQASDADQSDTIQAILSASTPPENSGTIWLKFEGTSSHRRSLTERYSPHMTQQFPEGITCYPKSKKPRVANGDYIYAAVLCVDELPYIVGRGRSAGYNEGNVATQEMIANYGWMADFPNYCRYTVFEYLDAPIAECIPLNKILQDLGSSTYVSTIGKPLTIADMRIRHRQQAHMRLTSQAKAYIDDLFDDLAKKHGTCRTTAKLEDLMDKIIIMRLSNSFDNQGVKYGAEETMQEYIADQKLRGYTWFSTNALHAGMAIEKVKKFNDAISQGRKVSILFAIGKTSGGTNEIAYKANVLEVRSTRQPEALPTNEYPALWHGEEATVWLKIENLQLETVLKANMFKFSETGDDLHDVIIGKNQFSFGYITYK